MATTRREVTVNLLWLAIVLAVTLPVPFRYWAKATKDPHRLAITRGRTLAKELMAREPSAAATSTEVLKAIDPTLDLAWLPGVVRSAGNCA